MKRFAPMAAAIALCLALAIPAACANLFLEPGVEGGTQTLSGTAPGPGPTSYMTSADTPWSCNWDGYQYTVFTVAPGGHTGSYCIQGYDYGGASPVGLQQVDVPLDPNSDYTVSFWYKTSGSGWGAGNICQVQLYINGAWNKVLTNLGASPSWMRVSFTFNTGESDTSGGLYLNTYQGGGAAGDSIYFDDFDLEKVTPPPPPNPGPPVNCDFETGTLTAWNVGGYPPYVTWQAAAEAAHAGDFGAEGIGGSANGVSTLTSSYFDLDPGTVYQIEYYYKTVGPWATGAQPAIVDIRFHEYRLRRRHLCAAQ